MKKNKQKSASRHVSQPKISLSVLCKALMAAGLLSAVPTFAGTLPPLPTPCAGNCSGNNPAFLQYGSLKTPLPITAGKVMTINQTSQTAILNWQNFNIDQGYTVTFNQPSTSASTLNRILDPYANPTTIAGSLNANGQIYLINQNGIVFKNGAQVNTGTLIASSLDIKDSLYEAGYLTNTQLNPAFQDTCTVGNPLCGGFVRVDTGATLNGSTIMLFAPVVENSGNISTHDGQVVMAAGNNVYLEASQDPNLRGVLVEVDVKNPNQIDPSLAATNSQPAQVQNNKSGTVSNFGSILSQRGNVTLVGYAVNQQGLISATTAVNENGTIKLEARYNVENGVLLGQDANNPTATINTDNSGVYDIRATQTGAVTFGGESMTQVMPDSATAQSTTTASQGFNPSIIEAMGNTIEMQSGSSIVAPGGIVTLAAISSYVPATATTPASGLIPLSGANNPYQNIFSTNAYNGFLNPNYLPSPSSGTDGAMVLLDKGSTIDVSGSTASVSVARNILAVQLRGAELANSPLQKTGPLYGQTVYVDISKGTPLANYSGEEAQIQRGVAELTSSGGTVNLISTGGVVTNPGSNINISGGQVDYTGAYVTTTSLIGSNGAAYNIANASPNMTYTGIAGTYTESSAKWGVTQTFNTMPKTWDPGYVQGQAAGKLTILSPGGAVEGNIISKTVAGLYQTQPYVNQTATSPYVDTYAMLPRGGTLTLGDSTAIYNMVTDNYNYVTNAYVTIQPNPLVTYSLTDALALPTTIYLDPSLFSAANSVNNVGIYTNGTVTVGSGTSLALAPGGSLTLQGDTINMLGSVYIPSGTVTMGTVATATSPGTLAGGITLGSAGSTISTRGMWVNDAALLDTTGATSPVFINGGNVTINSGGILDYVPGTVIDASGGAYVNASNKVQGGNGGSISLTGNYAVNSRSPKDYLHYTNQLATISPGLKSYGVAGGQGGGLTVNETGILGSNGNGIVIGGTETNALNLAAGFFSTGGFSSYTLSANGGGLLVAPDTSVTVKSQSLILDNSALQKASSSDVYSFSQIGTLPDWQRKPVSITLKQNNGVNGLTVGMGAGITVDPGATINLTSDSQLIVLGTLDAPAGSINLTLNSPISSFNNGNSYIWLGSQSELLAQGAVVMTPNAQGLSLGQVLSGGTINLNSNMFVVTQQGSMMDVSGAAANLDLPQLESNKVVYSSNLVAGNAGKIAITATEGALLDGSMKAGVLSGSTAAAGSFSLTLAGTVQSQRNLLSGFPQNPTWNILVGPSGSGSFVVDAENSGNVVIDAGNANTNLTYVDGLAYVDPSALQKAGFDAVTLTSGYGSIVLADQVKLDARQSITLNAPVIDLTGNKASITSDYVQLANTNLQNQVITPPSSGNGILSVTANLVDITGDVSVSGISQLSINSSGDIRLNGVLYVAPAVNGVTPNSSLVGQLTTQGNITLQANQIYPTTLSDFTLAVVDGSAIANPAGTITILPGSGSSPVLSAGGQVTLSAANIVQDGVLKAPLGTINLGVNPIPVLIGTQIETRTGTGSVTLAPGSLTSVSADGQIIPYGTMVGGTGWVYDLAWSGGNPLASVTLTAPPQKQITIQGTNVDIQAATNNAPAAKIDLSGGGDLYAYEFIPGTGGTLNVLNPAQGPANTYAIIPSLSGLSAFAPYDPQFSGQYAASGSKSALGVGSTVYLSGGDGLSAGYYALLPASYALLPGAYTVTLVSGHQDMLPGQGAIQVPGGGEIMAGKLAVAGTNILDSRWSGFEVAPGSVARTESQFQDNYASSYFSSLAATNGTVTPYLPVDAGQLAVTANSGATVATLVLNGTIDSQPGAGGLGAQVDLSVVGSGFDIVNTIGADNGLVQLTTGMLNNLGANSLLIGGVRTQTTSGMSIAVGADTVQVDNAGSTLQGPEIMLAANTSVKVIAGSSIQGVGKFSGQANNITIDGGGALLRVSTGPQVSVARTNVNPTSTIGTLTIADPIKGTTGATLGTANNALLFDASYSTAISNTAVLNGSAISVAAQNIDVGTVPSSVDSTYSVLPLSLSGTLLSNILTFQDITLHSYNDINFASSLAGSDANHRISSLTLNAKNLNGYNTGLATIDATSIVWMNNNSGPSTAPTGTTAGNLNINADSIVIADGNKGINGFGDVYFTALNEISMQGTGAATIASGDGNVHNLVLQAGQITATSNAKQSITASNYDINIEPNSGTAFASTGTLGAQLVISGKNITDTGVINVPTGSITLHATGTGSTDNVTLAGVTTLSNAMVAGGTTVTVGSTANLAVGEPISGDGFPPGTTIASITNGTQFVTSVADTNANSTGVALQVGSLTSAKGISETLAGQIVYAPAGTINLTADNGEVDIQSGATLNVSGATGGGNAGSIKIAATNGPVSIAGSLKGGAAAANTQGSFTVDANKVNWNGTDNVLTDLNNILTQGGFTQLRDIRVRTGNLDIYGTTAQANTFQLEADAGNIDVYGTINSSGTSGGNIQLMAQNVTLDAGAMLDAHASGAGQAGGQVTIEASSTGQINLNNQPINVQGGANGTSGSVLLRAPRINWNTDTNSYSDVALYNTGGTSLNVSPNADVTVEAFQTYAAPSNGILTAAYVGTACVITSSCYLSDATAFYTYANTIKTNLGMSLTDPNMNLVPGVEIDSAANPSNPSGSLTLAANWDLSSWRFSTGIIGQPTEPGILTLRATGDLAFGTVNAGVITTASLSDGFSSAITSPKTATLAPGSGSSWSYQLVAGADMTSANVMAVNNTVASLTGNVQLVAGSESAPVVGTNIITPIAMEEIRTGTGFIDIAAGGDVSLGNADSVIYTAGVASPVLTATGATGYKYGQSSVFPVDGGNINISADGNINGAYANQLVSEWLWRQGFVNVPSTTTYVPAPAWWINYAAFRQNIGALGGGNVTISAGGDINNLSAVVPTSGYVGSSGNMVILGGGNLTVTAGGNINSGIFYVGSGLGTIQAGGGLGAYTYPSSALVPYNPYSLLSTNPNTILLLGQGGFAVQAEGDINLQTVLNPTMLGSSFSQKISSNNNNIGFFYTYDGGGNISLTSLGGNINLDNTLGSLTGTSNNPVFWANTPPVDNVYPASFEATAFNGGINNSTSANFLLFPSSTGNLQLFAATNINLGDGIGMSDMSPASLLPINSLGVSNTASIDTVSHGIDPTIQLPVPLHANDTQPITIVAGGDITTGDPSNLAGNTNAVAVMELPKQALVSAGRDIINFSADIQNQQPTDTTSLVAGRDITFTTQEVAGITVSGPGQVVLQAGRNIDLGYSFGVVTEGNLNNPLLPSQGANITVLAGVGQAGADAQAFINKYIDPAAQGIYGADLIAFVSQYVASPNLTAEQAFSFFNNLPTTLQNAFVNQVFFDELRLSGRSAISSGDYSGGYTAISTLFPTGGYSGDLSLFNSQIKTEAGGNINILTPGGGVDAGLANVNTGKPASEIGVVTVGGGDINAFVNNDFTVNQSRVFTVQGGNILMWSSNANIDAGNGSKTATSTPPPLLVVNPKTGEFAIDATDSIVGSGIRVLLGNPNVVPGSVDLFAPKGTINAGDAGIGAAGNIFLGALQVIGANNINFGGTSAGVPTTAVAPVSVGGMGNVQDANQAANQATQGLSNASALAKLADLANFKPTFISVDVIGLGDENMGSQQ